MGFISVSPGASLAETNQDLIEAIYRAKVEAVRDLPARGADMNACGRDLWNPWMVAASTGQNEIVELLPEKNADVFSSETIFSFKLSPILEGGRKVPHSIPMSPATHRAS